MNLAIISPNQNAFSETFIQAHKGIPGVKVFYYYGGLLPAFLEGSGALVNMDLPARLKRAVIRKLFPSVFSVEEDAFLQSLKENSIDCVLAEYGTTGSRLLPLCKKANIPLVVHFHGYDASRNEILEKNKESYLEMFQYSTAIIAVSRKMEEKLIAIGCPKRKIMVNPCGPNDSFLEIQPEFKKKLFVGIGRFVDKKAPYYTILAFKEALKQHPEAQLIIGGNGPLWNTTLNLVKHLGLEKSVILPGVLTPLEFQAHLKEACAFVQHSITAYDGDMEGTPVAVLEASAAGLPVISTFHAGIPDVIIDGETGLLCQEHNVDGMAKNMIRILDNFDFARKLGAAGKKRVKENFSMDKHLGILSEVVKKTVNSRK